MELYEFVVVLVNSFHQAETKEDSFLDGGTITSQSYLLGLFAFHQADTKRNEASSFCFFVCVFFFLFFLDRVTFAEDLHTLLSYATSPAGVVEDFEGGVGAAL